MMYKLSLSYEGAIALIPATRPVEAVVEGGGWPCFKGHFGWLFGDKIGRRQESRQ